MKKSALILLIVMVVAACAVLTSCQTKAQEPAVEYMDFGLEFKNKTEKTVVGLYLYPAGSAELYPNIVDGFGMDGKWAAGKVKVYPKGFVTRPIADTYEVKLVFEDGTEMIISDIELLKADSDGRLPNELSFKPDANDIKVQFDDDEDVQPAIDEAIKAGIPLDGFVPAI